MTDVNRHEHLEKVVSKMSIYSSPFHYMLVYTPQVRQKGGVGSAAHDPKQQDIRAFFGGGKIPAAAVEGLEEGQSLSNAKDEVDVDIQ